MSEKRYYTAKEAAKLLGVSRSTLYAYVSRGLIRSEQAAGGERRQRRYYAEDIEKLRARKEGRRNPEKLAQDALHWGAPVLDSSITLIDNDNLYYRGQDVTRLAQESSVEEVAALLWTGAAENATHLFNPEALVSAERYEAMLLHMQMDGANLSALQELQTMLPAAMADDLSAYDLRPAIVAQTGARILRLMVSVVAGDNVPENLPLAEMLQQGICPHDEQATRLLNAALILMADHELNASSFAARIVASVRATPYAAVLAGLAALQGSKHGGETMHVEAFFRETGLEAKNAVPVLQQHLQRSGRVPGFGHRLYPAGDPRARVLVEMLREHYPDHPVMDFGSKLIETAQERLDAAPSADFALVLLAHVLGLDSEVPITLFALGRSIGWIGHSIEQYEQDRMIRPRARYTGSLPHDSA